MFASRHVSVQRTFHQIDFIWCQHEKWGGDLSFAWKSKKHRESTKDNDNKLASQEVARTRDPSHDPLVLHLMCATGSAFGGGGPK